MKAITRQKFYRQVDPEAWEAAGISPLNQFVLGFVLLSIAIAVLQSESAVRSAAPGFFIWANWCLAVSFSLEYGARLWIMGESSRYGGSRGRLRYALTWASLLDLIATLAIWVDVLVGVPGIYGVLLRLTRAIRILSLTRNSTVGMGIRLLFKAVDGRRVELGLSLVLAVLVLLVASVLLYLVEGRSQPDSFGSIPRAMWWAMATLTTVGYGDVYPVTAFGKVLAGLTAISSIAIVAMPAGIMAAAFSNAFQKLQESKE
jgi:voltage-gated potassium channel